MKRKQTELKREKQTREPADNFSRLVPNAVIVLVITIFLYDILFYTEHWPFSSHRMYSVLTGPTYVKNEVFMVTPDGEVPMDVPVHLKPLGNSRLTYMLKNIVRLRDRRATKHALASLARIYERNKMEHKEDWPEMIGLKIYRLQWQLDPELKNIDYPQKTQMIGFRFR
jgi:hypothetical protein